MEQFCKFVNSRGILKSTDHHNKNPQSSNARVDSDIIDNLKPMESIYVCYEALPNFVEYYLRGITVPFILVSGDSDHHPAMYMDASNQLLNNQYLQKWWNSNVTINDPKMGLIPCGMDYHTQWEKPGVFGLRQLSAFSQERMVMEILRDSPLQNKKYGNFYVNWHLAMRGDRQDCLDKIDKDFCYFEKLLQGRKYMYQRQSEFLFTVCPAGASYDCHRNYETILVGSVPIIKKHIIQDHLYDDLPVIKVDDWSEVNRNMVQPWMEQILSKDYDFNPLFLNYWTSKIQGKEQSPLPRMGLLEFRELLTANYF